jgi:hypothetical protein
MTSSPHPTANETTSVKGVLTPNLRAAGPRTDGARRSSKRRRTTPVENSQYAAFAVRVIRAHARRIAEGDVEVRGPDLLGHRTR